MVFEYGEMSSPPTAGGGGGGGGGDVQNISECFVKPKHQVEASKQPIYLPPWDLALLSTPYIRRGLLFLNPPPSMSNPIKEKDFLERLKNSLSLALVHFYPLAGRLVSTTAVNQEINSSNHQQLVYSVHIDCTNSPGAKLIHATLESTVSDILSPIYVPSVVQSFFDHDSADDSLLSIKVTELVDGVFIGCSVNHGVADGTSFWKFLNALSEIFTGESDGSVLSRPPIHKRFFPGGCGPILGIPLSIPSRRHQEPRMIRERVFHFSAEAIARLKSKANSETTRTISSLLAVSAVLWRSVTRARRLPPDQETGCKMVINNRTRLYPPLPEEYFGNSLYAVRGATTAGELEGKSLGWAASVLQRAVAGYDDKAVREMLENWRKAPFVVQSDKSVDPCTIMIVSSPRFNMYGNEFGLGKPVAIRNGSANNLDGKVSLNPGHEGGGSMDLEICLVPDVMSALECDEEFIGSMLFSSN